MRMTRAHAFALGTILAVSGGAAAVPPPTPSAAGRITSVTLAATTPATFRGVCSPSREVKLQGKFTTDISQPTDKSLGNPAQFIWSDWKVNPSHIHALSSDRRETTVDETRYFAASFDGWVKLQVDPWKTGRPRESSQVAVKITCEPPASKQLQQLPAGPAHAPTPGR